MRLFVLFAPRFLSWPLAIVNRLLTEMPRLTITGLVTGGDEIYRVVANHPASQGANIGNLAQLESLWLSRDVTDGEKKEVLGIFSYQDYKRIIISDRNIGRRYVSGAAAAKTPLMAACEKDANIERYVFNLCLWVINLWRKERFNSVLCYSVAGAPAMALRLFCARTNVPFIRFVHSRVGNGLIVDASSEGVFTSVRAKFECYLHKPNIVDDNTTYAKNYLDQFVSCPERPTYAVKNSEKMLRQLSVSHIIRRFLADTYAAMRRGQQAESKYLRRAYGLTWIVHNLASGWTALRLARHWPYDRVADIGDQGYIYYPLHVDPEASTMVLAPMLTNQLMILEALSKALPVNMRLVVKEHLPMLGKRPPGFYEAIRRLPGVMLLSPHEDNFDLIKNSKLVSVITGTAAWEALLLGRPALIFGNVPFECISDGFVQCSDFSRLPEAVNQALALTPASRDRMVAFLAAVHSECIDLDLWNIEPEDFEETEREHLLSNIANKLLGMSTTEQSGISSDSYAVN